MASEKDSLVRARAYQLWEQGGRRQDSAEEDWAEAERSVASEGGETTSKKATPAGEPAADRKPRKPAAAAAGAEPKAPRAPAGKGRGKGGAAGA